MTAISWRYLPVGILAVIIGCSKPHAAPPASPTKPAGPPATIPAKPEAKPARRLIERPAYIQAFEETPLVARIAGYVEKVNVDIGARVEKGQVLAELHVPEMEVELKHKEASLRQADAELRLAKDYVPLAEAEFKRLKSQSERFAKVGSGVLDKENIEETLFAFEASKAKLEMARSDVSVKEARLAVAKEHRDYAKTMLDYRKVRAPYDGVITRRNVHTGDFRQPGSGTAAPLFVIARTDIVRVFVEVPETEAPLVRDGMPACVRVQALKDQACNGTVTRSSWSLDPHSRTLRVEIDIPNPEGRLRSGMYAYVTLIAE
jgi:multidrug resistance efflux pump